MRTYLLASIALITACGGGDGPPVQQGTVNTAGAQSSVESVHEILVAMEAADGQSAANAVMALTAAGQIVVSPVAPSPRALVGMVPRDWSAKSASPRLTGSAACTESGCTFVDLGDDTEFGSYRINGSIQRTGDLLTFDLTYDLTLDSLVFHWDMDGRITVTPTLIDGEIHSNGNAEVTSEGESYAVSWGFDVIYDRIVLDDGGCPIGGSLSATVAYELSGATAGGYHAGGSLRFGPTCGQYGSN